tara:strand:- start:172 stop:441 length:270 start_codon:yes stop_codon:yes gene_type:complete
MLSRIVRNLSPLTSHLVLAPKFSAIASIGHLNITPFQQSNNKINQDQDHTQQDHQAWIKEILAQQAQIDIQEILCREDPVSRPNSRNNQ